MRSEKGITVENVTSGSIAETTGLRAGDTIYRINSYPVRDVIDFMFHKNDGELKIDFTRGSSKKKISIISDNGADLGISFRPMKVRICKNNCVFCFVKQLPRGLRKPLYVKDEDYRLSFLYGNYTTLSNITTEEKKRIVEQRLSPMYISVHSTNRHLRNRMLGNPKASDIMKELKFFADHKIRMHIQIVLCPGLNDKNELRSTIQDIYRFYPYVSSIAVVPVGLTKHRKVQLAPVTREDALNAIGLVDSFQKRFRKRHGEALVYSADEMYIKAELPFPQVSDYGELPQIENGVGMVPLFLSQARRVKTNMPVKPAKKILTFTGTSFYPYLKKFISRISDKEGITLDLIPVENRFFGSSVTVTGLITGRDVIAALNENPNQYDILVVPDVVLREGDTLFLDNVSLQDLQDAAGLNVITTDCTPQGLIETLAGIA